MDEVRIARLRDRIKLLTARGSYNNKIIAKLKRQLRKFGLEA